MGTHTGHTGTTMSMMNMTGSTMDMSNMHDMHNMGDMDNMNHMHMHMGNDSCSGGMMMMYFHTGSCEYILFEQLKTTKTAEMIGACIVIFVLAMAYEGLKVLREYLLQRAMSGNKYTGITHNPSRSQDTMVVDGKANGSGGLTLNQKPQEIKGSQLGEMNQSHNYQYSNSRIHMISGTHFTQTVLHVIQVFISYCLMLVFMTYNAWLCIAIILGAGAGYFFFGWKRAIVVDVNEHCH